MKTIPSVRYLAIAHPLARALPFDAFAAPNPTLWPMFLWRGRERSEMWLGMGWAGVFASLEDCRAALANVDFVGDSREIEPRGFAVVGFDPDAKMGEPWAGFSSRMIVLPEALARIREDRADLLLLRPMVSRDDLAEAEIECRCRTAEVRAVIETPQERSEPVACARGENFSRAQWRRSVKTIRAKISTGELCKAVLARSAWREALTPWSASAILERLAAERDDNYLFAHRIGEDAFLGASPERLLWQRGREIAADSLAGTRPRGDELARELLRSDKERTEQNHVTEFLREQLSALCEQVSPPAEPQIRPSATLQHLFTEVSGRLRESATLDDVVAALHPTPAVCGAPREAASKLIAALESEPRGLYAGAIGWVSATESEFAVTIRSARISGARATFFAGAGIVAASDADAEWEETELKMQPLLRALEG